MTEDQWEKYLIESRGWAVRVSVLMLHSEAYKELSNGPALKVLNWFHEKIRLKKDKKRRGFKRWVVVNDGEFSFTYKEAGFRGLTSYQYRKALKELYELGFIEIKKPGSALKGDYTIFKLSDHWKGYRTQSDRRGELPKSALWRNFGYGSSEKT